MGEGLCPLSLINVSFPRDPCTKQAFRKSPLGHPQLSLSLLKVTSRGRGVKGIRNKVSEFTWI